MWLRSHRGTATRWICLIAWQVTVSLLLQSCKTDRGELTAEARANEQPRDRPVFGSPPETGQSRTRERRPESNVPPEQKGSQTERAAAHVPRPTAPNRTTVKERSRVADPGESRAATEQVGSLEHEPRAQPAERFAYYRPPGSVLGDTGERARRGPEPQVSPSANPIEHLLWRWADTLMSRDAAAHMRLYAPTLERFHGESDVSRETVGASKQQIMRSLAGVRRFEIHQLRLRPSADGSVEAEFLIESDTADRKIPGRYILRLRQVDGQWRIYSEEKMSAVSRGRARQ